MRKLFSILISTMFFMLSAHAGSYQVPKDAVIKVFDKNGKQIGEMSRSEYKVVKIVKSRKVLKIRKLNKQYREKHSSFIVHAGIGKNGLNEGHDGSNHVVREKDAMVFGATYCYTKKGSGICATGMTNKTYTIGVKKDF